MAERQGRRARHFSLVELLIVIVVIIVILGISMPSFKNMLKGHSVNAAARMISSQLMLARAEAITRREYIAVVMPDGGFKADDEAGNFGYQSFRAAVVEPYGDPNKFKLKEWVKDTKWNFLPQGAIIAKLEDFDSLSTIEYDSGSYRRKPGDFSFEPDSVCKVEDGTEKLYTGKTNSDVSAVVFKPNGRCMKNAVISICEGIMVHGENTPQKVKRDNLKVLKVDQYTGQVSFLY